MDVWAGEKHAVYRAKIARKAKAFVILIEPTVKAAAPPNLFIDPELTILDSYLRKPQRAIMKPDIHPVYATATVRCACGNTYQTRSTQAEIHTDICANCHPFFTGKQKLVDTAGRVERFRQKYGKQTAGSSSES